jgi:hypothetical protein
MTPPVVPGVRNRIFLSGAMKMGEVEKAKGE